VHGWWGCDMIQPLWKTVQCPQNSKMKPSEPLSPIWVHRQKDGKQDFEEVLHTHVHTIK
jgi:hypothetical protein